MRYRKKPVVVDAIRVSEVLGLASTGYDMLPSWLFGGEIEPGKTTGSIVERSHCIVRTL